MMPNQEQIMSLARAFLMAVGTAMVAKGYISSAILEPLIGLVVMVVPVVWSMYAHTESNAVAVVAAIPAVSKVEVTATPAGLALRDAAGSKPDARVMVAS